MSPAARPAPDAAPRYLLVDGHSVIHSWPELRSLHSRQPTQARRNLIRDLSARADNDPGQAAEYRRVLFGFCKDWRALWYQYGIQEAGWLHYDALLKATLAALPEGNPPVLGHDNGVEAKRIFLERVGYAAVVPRVHQQFLRGVPTMATIDPNLSRNAPCPCGSGQRYKHCHGAAG